MNDEPEEYQFFDTNILIYGHDQTASRKHQIAKGLLQENWQSRTGCLSIQVLQEFYVNITRKISIPLTIAEATRIISQLGGWYVHTPTVEDILGAIQIQQRYQISFWDAMIVRSAARLGCAVLWSEDLNSGQQYKGVMVKNPFV